MHVYGIERWTTHKSLVYDTHRLSFILDRSENKFHLNGDLRSKTDNSVGILFNKNCTGGRNISNHQEFDIINQLIDQRNLFRKGTLFHYHDTINFGEVSEYEKINSELRKIGGMRPQNPASLNQQLLYKTFFFNGMSGEETIKRIELLLR